MSNTSIVSKEVLLSIFGKLQDIAHSNLSGLHIDTAKGDGLQFKLGNKISDKTVRVFCCAKYVKYSDLPNTYRKTDGVEHSLAEDNDENTGVTEETHFVIDLQYDSPIIAIETSGAGPKAHSIKTYLEHWCRVVGIDTEIQIAPIIGRNLDQFMQVMSECASLELKVAKNNIPDIANYEKALGTILESSLSYAQTDFVKLVIGFEFNVPEDSRSSTGSLITKVKQLVGINKRNPEFFRNFDTVQVRAKENDEQLKIYDLIADRTAAEIFVGKRSQRSKYFDSQEMYNEIEKEFGRNFGPPPKP